MCENEGAGEVCPFLLKQENRAEFWLREAGLSHGPFCFCGECFEDQDNLDCIIDKLTAIDIENGNENRPL